MKIYIDSNEIDYFIVNPKTGTIIGCPKADYGEWDSVKIDLNTIKIGKKIKLTFNKKVYTELNYVTTRIEQ